jgi:carbamate kinase
VEAVIDKDRTAALLATELAADALLLLTDVPAVYADWPERARPLRDATPAELRRLDLDPGSMGPKVEAACRFAEQTGRAARIGALEDARHVLEGKAGTSVSVR